jgi:hypothetical protein
MKFLIDYFERRFMKRYLTTMAIYGSCHSKVGYRSKWNPMRFLLGPIHTKILHPLDVLCTCDWNNTQKTDIWDRYGRDKQ